MTRKFHFSWSFIFDWIHQYSFITIDFQLPTVWFKSNHLVNVHRFLLTAYNLHLVNYNNYNNCFLYITQKAKNVIFIWTKWMVWFGHWWWWHNALAIKIHNPHTHTHTHAYVIVKQLVDLNHYYHHHYYRIDLNYQNFVEKEGKRKRKKEKLNNVCF